MEKLEAAIEAILFSAGDSVETGRIAKAIGQDKNTTEKIIRNMMLKYNARDRGIKILELDGAFQMCTKQEYYEYLPLINFWIMDSFRRQDVWMHRDDRSFLERRKNF